MWICQNSYPIIKSIEWSFSLSLQSSLLSNLNYVGPKKIYGGHKYFFKDTKIIKFSKFIYNNNCGGQFDQ